MVGQAGGGSRAGIRHKAIDRGRISSSLLICPPVITGDSRPGKAREVVTYVQETPPRAAPLKTGFFVATSPLDGEGCEPPRRTRDGSDSEDDQFLPPRAGVSRSRSRSRGEQLVAVAQQAMTYLAPADPLYTYRRQRTAAPPSSNGAWQQAGLHTEGVSVWQSYDDHPLRFERQCRPRQPAEAPWLNLPTEKLQPPPPPYPQHPPHQAAKLVRQLTHAFATRCEPRDEAGVPTPVFSPVEGSPSATALDAHGRHLLPEGLAWRSVVFDERRHAIQWPWENGAPRQQQMDLSPTASCPDPAAKFFVNTVSATTAGTHALDATVNEGLRNATAKGDGGENSTGTRGWKSFCRRHSRAADRPIDPMAPLAVKLDEEQWCMRFVADIIDSRDVAVDTAKSYFHAASGWHQRKHGIGFAGGLDMRRLPEMVKGLRRVRDKPHEAKVRRGVAPQKLRKALDKLFPSNGTSENANVRAMVTTAFQALLRGREVCSADGKSFNGELDLARGDIAALLEDRVVFFMRPAKNMRHTKGKTVPIVIGAGGELIDAHAEISEMLRLDPVARSAAADTPMFRRADGGAFTVAQLRDIVKALMRAVGEPEDEFGAHSLRIGGATALFAAGADPVHIKTMGRWSSDCWRLYVRACFESTLQWTRAAGSTPVNDVAGMKTVAAEVDMIFGTDDA